MTRGTCTGIVLDEHRIATARHCIAMNTLRAILPTGQEIFIEADRVEEILDQDLAILTTAQRIALPQFAQLASPTSTITGTIIGFCPYYVQASSRQAEYLGRALVFDDNNVLQLLDGWRMTWTSRASVVCGGDSGGAVMQNGKVVGLISSVQPLVADRPVGVVFATVPLDYILELYAASQSKVPSTH